MAVRKTGSSTAQRLRTSASNRLTEALLSSSGQVAGVGLATAIVTFGFAIWFGFELRYQSEVGVPLAKSASHLNASIAQTAAASRAWVAYGDSRARTARSRIWREEIEPTLAGIAALAERSAVRDTQARVATLRGRLRELQIAQWALEDVAQTPGNEPASVVYERRLVPLRSNILSALDAAIEHSIEVARSRDAIEFVADLARFRSGFNRADISLAALLRSLDDVAVNRTRQRISEARNFAIDVEASKGARTEGDLRSAVDFAIDEFRAYDAQVQEVIALRSSDAWNTAQNIAFERAIPLERETRLLASDLASVQVLAIEENADQLTRSSYLVIAMALVMGLLSAGSLFVSYRLQRQVQNVMARAKRLGQYEIEQRIGKGGMGEVYLARHAMLRRPSALKLLRAENARDLRAQSRFQREVQLTCQLTHPNTIEIFDYGRTPQGIFYYAMEYLDGFTLEALVREAGPVDPARVVHILLQACGSLQEAHERGLLHRDIKPSNIMLTTRGGICDTVKILDFGLVKDLSDDDVGVDDERDVIVGTPMYMAPELILSPDSNSPAADIYALGAVAYFMLSGSTVFPPGELLEILEHQLEDDAPFPSERLGRSLPQDLEYLIMHCLAKNPADRPASAARLAEMLLACECGSWTAEDAGYWWEEYGEALRERASLDENDVSDLVSQLEVAVDVTAN